MLLKYFRNIAFGDLYALYPNARVKVLVSNQIVELPALIVLGLWIVLQVFSGVGSIAQTAQTEDVGGVAYMAHVGGFVAGFVLTFILRDRSRGAQAG